ncbi:MAG: cysteine peptidase family C39 domain-containing protein [Gammaproteobacteria bacterium]|nr:cysteine peptidase family C39 domain-containing protein [Gammaproteobacteria bacterium]MCW8910913.1 cysteine peptidase family C39 domain-containing protein [Gammaproteobacteria bacterium]MCW9005630.1 cysteine peptidase family C39 domain-containing protein [Gammaproteobacteria bacterium]MCW9057163.1 cysteine peptidase family C39 domain-containing protein [Gammaproteobacteria bacterium]
MNRLLLLLIFVFFQFAVFFSQANAQMLGVNTAQTRLTASVIPWSEIRKHSLVRQGWDISCGAAALSTLMTYFHNHPVTETSITLTLLKNTDSKLVRKRGGFSLLDLKRYVNAIGYEGRGYGGMSLDDIESFAVPAILPVRIREFDHFVVYRGRLGNRVLLGDPAFGNITLAIDEFNTMWRSKVAFFVVKQNTAEQLEAGEYKNNISQLTPKMMELAIPDLSYTQRIIKTVPFNPVLRKTVKAMQ